MSLRIDGRDYKEIRPITIIYGIYGNSQGSVLFQQGNTKVLCSVMLQDGVPHFLRGTGSGWLTAEYSLLPASTQMRSVREASVMRRNNRSIEISRLIGRSLRSVLNLKLLGEKTIYLDCDVLEADGGTRTAAINGAYCALNHAIALWIEQSIIKKTLFTDTIAAISVGLKKEQFLLDVDFMEDSTVDADFNFVMTGSGAIIEVQGAAEKAPISWDSVIKMRQAAYDGIQEILTTIAAVPCVPPTKNSLYNQQQRFIET